MGGLLQILGSAGEGFFKASKENIEDRTKDKRDKKLADALELREANLAKLRHKYRTEEIGKQARLSGKNTTDDITNFKAAKARGWEGELPEWIELYGVHKKKESTPKKPTTSDKKYEETQAWNNLTASVDGYVDQKERTIEVISDSDGNVDAETLKAIENSGFTIKDEGTIEEDRDYWFTGSDYVRRFKLGAYTPPSDSLLGGTSDATQPGGGESVEEGPRTGEKAKIISFDTIIAKVNGDQDPMKDAVKTAEDTEVSGPGLLAPNTPEPEFDKGFFNHLAQQIASDNPSLSEKEVAEMAMEEYRKAMAEKEETTKTFREAGSAVAGGAKALLGAVSGKDYSEYLEK